MNRNYLKAALAGTSEDKTRESLTGVLFQRNENNVKIISTNGHVLFRSEIHQTIEDAPMSKDNGAYATVNDTIVPPHVCEQLLKLCKPSKGYARDGNTELYIGDKAALVNLETPIPFVPIDGQFPNYSHCIPEKKGYVFTLDVAKLEQVVKYAKAIRDAKNGKGSPFGIRFFTQAPDRGVYFELECSDHGEGKFYGVVMPIMDLPVETKEEKPEEKTE